MGTAAALCTRALRENPYGLTPFKHFKRGSRGRNIPRTALYRVCAACRNKFSDQLIFKKLLFCHPFDVTRHAVSDHKHVQHAFMICRHNYSAFAGHFICVNNSNTQKDRKKDFTQDSQEFHSVLRQIYFG